MDFTHAQSAHCETGVMSSILNHGGLAVSEPMALGLSNAIAFAYIPVVKMAGQPLISYRLPPKAIIKGLSKRLGIGIRFEKFTSPMAGAEALEKRVQQGHLVGLQTSVFWLPYFPEEMRFHFNAHNMLVYGQADGEYLVSDPIFEEPVRVSEKDLTKARFAKGPLAPKGLMYWAESIPEKIDYEQHIPKAIKKNIRIMTGAPLPIIGIRGIRHVAQQIRKLPRRKSAKDQRLYLGNIVRMQEEIGTGGAGFRFMYASFLAEAAGLLNEEQLGAAAESMTEVGDLWREFALLAAQSCKATEAINTEKLAQHLDLCASKEKEVWAALKSWHKAGTKKSQFSSKVPQPKNSEQC